MSTPPLVSIILCVVLPFFLADLFKISAVDVCLKYAKRGDNKKFYDAGLGCSIAEVALISISFLTYETAILMVLLTLSKTITLGKIHGLTSYDNVDSHYKRKVELTTAFYNLRTTGLVLLLISSCYIYYVELLSGTPSIFVTVPIPVIFILTCLNIHNRKYNIKRVFLETITKHYK